MANPVDLVEKLIALALNNPSEEEAKSAALKAVSLIHEHSLPVGAGSPDPIRVGRRTYTPDPEFEQVLADLLKHNQNPDEFVAKVVYQDTEIDDDFMRKRVKKAWEEIRLARKRLEGEIYRYERETGRRYPRE